MKAYELRNESGSTTLAMVERARPVTRAGRGFGTDSGDLAQLPRPADQESASQCAAGSALRRRGEVVEVGVGVNSMKVGDHVAGTYFQDWVSGPVTKNIFRTVLGQTIDGVLAEYVVAQGARRGAHP